MCHTARHVMSLCWEFSGDRWSPASIQDAQWSRKLKKVEHQIYSPSPFIKACLHWQKSECVHFTLKVTSVSCTYLPTPKGSRDKSALFVIGPFNRWGRSRNIISACFAVDVRCVCTWSEQSAEPSEEFVLIHRWKSPCGLEESIAVFGRIKAFFFVLFFLENVVLPGVWKCKKTNVYQVIVTVLVFTSLCLTKEAYLIQSHRLQTPLCTYWIR